MWIPWQVVLTCQCLIHDLDREAPGCEITCLFSWSEYNPQTSWRGVKVRWDGASRGTYHHRISVIGVLSVASLKEVQSLPGTEVCEDQAHPTWLRDPDQPATEATAAVFIGVVWREYLILPIHRNVDRLDAIIFCIEMAEKVGYCMLEIVYIVMIGMFILKIWQWNSALFRAFTQKGVRDC